MNTEVLGNKNSVKSRKIETDNLFNSVSVSVKKATESLYLSKEKDDIFFVILEILKAWFYNTAIDYIESKLNFPYSNLTLSDLYWHLWNAYNLNWDFEEAIEAFKTARKIDKSNYFQSTIEILHIYMTQINLWMSIEKTQAIGLNKNLDITHIYMGEKKLWISLGKTQSIKSKVQKWENEFTKFENLINREFVEAMDVLWKEEFIELELYFVEAFLLLWLDKDASYILTDNFNEKKALYFLENLRYNLNIEKEKFTDHEFKIEVQKILFYYKQFEKGEFVRESYKEFLELLEDWKNYQDENFALFWTPSDELYWKMLNSAEIMFEKWNYENALKILSNLFSYSKNILNYDYYLDAVKLFSEIVNNSSYNYKYLEIFSPSDFILLSNDDYYLLWNIYYWLWNLNKALSVYINYYSIWLKKEEIREKTKNFLEILISNEDLTNFKIEENNFKEQYYTKIDDNWKVLVYQNDQKDMSRNFTYYLQDIYNKVCNWQII